MLRLYMCLWADFAGLFGVVATFFPYAHEGLELMRAWEPFLIDFHSSHFKLRDTRMEGEAARKMGGIAQKINILLYVCVCVLEDLLSFRGETEQRRAEQAWNLGV